MNKGTVYAILSAIFLSSGFIFVKYLLDYIDPFSLSAYWFIGSFVVSLIPLLIYRRKKLLILYKKYWKDGITIGIVNTVSVLLWYNTVNLLEPAIAAFIMRLTIVFTITLGIIFLKEKLSYLDIAGLIIAAIGTYVIGAPSFNEGVSLGILLAVITSLAIAFQLFVSKLFVKKINHLSLVNFRTFYTALFLTISVGLIQGLNPLPLEHLPLMMIGTTLTGVIGFLFFYKALEHADVSQVSIIRSADPFIVVIYSLIIFQTVPTGQELLGGTLIVLGVVISTAETQVNKVLNKGIRIAMRAKPWFM